VAKLECVRVGMSQSVLTYGWGCTKGGHRTRERGKVVARSGKGGKDGLKSRKKPSIAGRGGKSIVSKLLLETKESSLELAGHRMQKQGENKSAITKRAGRILQTVEGNRIGQRAGGGARGESISTNDTHRKGSDVGKKQYVLG